MPEGYVYIFLFVHDYTRIFILTWHLMVIGSLCVCMFVFGSVFMRLVVWISMFFCSDLPPPSRFQFKHENCVSVCVLSSVFMRLVVWISMFFLVLPSPPPSFNLSMKTYLLNTKKEPCWKKHPQIEKTQEDNYIFAAKCGKQTSPTWKNTRG